MSSAVKIHPSEWRAILIRIHPKNRSCSFPVILFLCRSHYYLKHNLTQVKLVEEKQNLKYPVQRRSCKLFRDRRKVVYGKLQSSNAFLGLISASLFISTPSTWRTYVHPRRDHVRPRRTDVHTDRGSPVDYENPASGRSHARQGAGFR